MSFQQNRRDINCSGWGPYSLQGIGLSHANPEGHLMSIIPYCGYMSSKSVFPQMRDYRKDFEVLHALPDLSRYAFRYLIEPDKSVFIDAEYTTIDKNSALLRLKYNNNSKSTKLMHSWLGFTFEPAKLKPKLILQKDMKVIQAEEYSYIDCKHSSWDEEMPYGITRDANATTGRAFSSRLCTGNIIKWILPENVKKCKYIFIRYTLGEDDFKIKLNNKILNLKGTNNQYAFSEVLSFDLEKTKELILKQYKSIMDFKVDCIILSEKKIYPEIKDTNISPNIMDYKYDDKLAFVKLKEFKKVYGIKSEHLFSKTEFSPRRWFKTLHTDGPYEIDYRLLTIANLNHPDTFCECRHLAMGTKILKLKLGESATQEFIISTGNTENEFKTNIDNACEAKNNILVGINKKLQTFEERFDGKFSDFAQKLSTQLLCNISYPGYMEDHFVKYYTPSKYYNTFYLWDMGMTGIGLTSVSKENSIDLLNQYFNEDSCPTPFIQHGTLLPIHIILYWQIYSVYKDKKILDDFFQKAYRMYEFFAGKDVRSRTRDEKTGLISTFSYVYNTGGWDDYPLQQIVLKSQRKNYYPVVQISQIILCAKLLRMAAYVLDKNDLISEFTADIEDFEKSLYKYQWNSKDEVFSYYDGENECKMKINNEDGNKGMDGYYPLVSQSVSKELADKFIKKLVNENHFLTKFGLTTVDKKASYYRDDGYWNGHVWAPHNWFFIKAMLTYGYSKEAYKVSQRLLKGFSDAYKRSGNISECLHNELGTEEHVPYFSGLTAPLLNVYDMFFGKAEVSFGFNIFAEVIKIKNKKTLKILSPFFKGKTSLILNLEAQKEYNLFMNDEKIKKIETDKYGRYHLTLNITKDEHKILIMDRLKNI